MGWKRRLGKLDRWAEEENRHNQDEDMEKEAEVARRENKRSDMCWGRVWMDLMVHWNGGRGSEEDGAVLWIKRGGGSFVLLLFPVGSFHLKQEVEPTRLASRRICSTNGR